MKPASARSRVGRFRIGSSRYVMAGVAVLSLLSVLSVYAHLLLVEHTTCPEHGELIDGPAGRAAGAPQYSAAERSRPQAHESWHALNTAEQHSHHHCEFVPKRREALTTATRAAPFIAPPVASPAARTPYAAPPRPTIALFRLAPKQSPPA